MNDKKIIATLEIKNNQIVSLDYKFYKQAIESAEKGEDEGIEYLMKLIQYKVHKANQIVSHRLHGYNNIYEEILDALLSYYAKKSDNDLKEISFNIIRNSFSEIILLSKEINIDLSILAYAFKGDKYDDCSEFKIFKNDLVEVYTFLINKMKKVGTDTWNIKTIKTILDMWEVDKPSNYSRVQYTKVKYLDLPICINIKQSEFFGAFLGNNCYILSIMNGNKDTTIEIEYDSKKNRLLTREERENKVPRERELLFVKYGIEIHIQYYLEEKTDILMEAYQIYSIETNNKIESSKQSYFSMKRSFENKAKEVYESEKKKEAYTKWTDHQKASYWAGKIHRWMREVGENNMDEVEFFEPKALMHIRKEEPNIDKLMPLILTQLARVWMFDIDDFFEKVNNRLGTSYSTSHPSN